tara:strand:- start:1093 stop:1206 length:114 start_codon:yes stop_codon:yes gene_type:complete
MKSKYSQKETIQEILRLKKLPQSSKVLFKIKKLQQLL